MIRILDAPYSLAPRPLLDLSPCNLRRRPFRRGISLGPGMLLRRARRMLSSSVLVVRGTTHLPQFEVFRGRQFLQRQ